MKDIKDYLHLYLGCAYVWKSSNGRSGGVNRYLSPAALVKYYDQEFKIRLKLRRVSSMTEEEKAMWDKLFNEADSSQPPAIEHAEEIRYLLSKGFDLFNLIDEGLALDAATNK